MGDDSMLVLTAVYLEYLGKTLETFTSRNLAKGNKSVMSKTVFKGRHHSTIPSNEIMNGIINKIIKFFFFILINHLQV